MPLKPLKITFNLASRMVDPDKPIHLDGLLAWARVQQAIRADDPNLIILGITCPGKRNPGQFICLESVCSAF